MPRLEVEEVLDQRLKMIRAMAPALQIVHDVRESDHGKYGFVTMTDRDSGLVGVDFIETDISWRRENAVDQYNEAKVILLPSSFQITCCL